MQILDQAGRAGTGLLLATVVALAGCSGGGGLSATTGPEGGAPGESSTLAPPAGAVVYDETCTPDPDGIVTPVQYQLLNAIAEQVLKRPDSEINIPLLCSLSGMLDVANHIVRGTQDMVAANDPAAFGKAFDGQALLNAMEDLQTALDRMPGATVAGPTQAGTYSVATLPAPSLSSALPSSVAVELNNLRAAVADAISTLQGIGQGSLTNPGAVGVLLGALGKLNADLQLTDDPVPQPLNSWLNYQFNNNPVGLALEWAITGVVVSIVEIRYEGGILGVASALNSTLQTLAVGGHGPGSPEALTTALGLPNGISQPFDNTVFQTTAAINDWVLAPAATLRDRLWGDVVACLSGACPPQPG